jgi:ferrous iron transport protein B
MGLGPLLMLGVLWLMFYVTFTLGAYPQGWIEDGFNYLAELGTTYIPEGYIQSLVVSGIIGGVGAGMGFTPLILIMFAMLVFLEDLGYMARVAYMMDKVMRVFGLHGMSVMPLIMSGGIPGGCAVPGVMSARTLRSPRERLATILTAPFMVCGAKTTAYLMLVAAFFPERPHRGHVPGGPCGVVFRTRGVPASALDRGQGREHPVRHGDPALPSADLSRRAHPHLGAGLAVHQEGRHRDPGGVHSHVGGHDLPRTPRGQGRGLRRPASGRRGPGQDRTSGAADEELDKLLSEAQVPITDAQNEAALQYALGGASRPCSSGHGPGRISLAGQHRADRGVCGQGSLRFHHGHGLFHGRGRSRGRGLVERPSGGRPGLVPAGGLSVFVFMLLYTPCMVTVVAIAKEAGWKWALFSVGGSMAFAFVVSVLVYHGTKLVV